MYNLLESLFASKDLYQHVLSPVCSKYNLTYMEMIILLFLANNPGYDTATHIVLKRHLTKSAVSMAVKSLQKKGLIKGMFIGSNHRSVHLTVCEAASEMIKDGKVAQNTYLDILMDGFSNDEKQIFKNYYMRITDNINTYHKKVKK